MGKIVVKGGRALCGEVVPQGSKNAVLPLIFASLTVRGISKIHGVPDIGDVDVAIKIILELGAVVTRHESSLIIDTSNLRYTAPSEELTSAIRASSYLLGSCLARFGEARISTFGGCNFDNRPIDMHLAAAAALGADFSDGINLKGHLRGGEIIFSKVSVGATINALIMASSAEGKTHIIGAATEPHVLCLVDFLRSAGARINRIKNEFFVEGTELRYAEATVIPDMIEAGTYLLLAPLTLGRISVSGAVVPELTSLLEVLDGCGIEITLEKEKITVFGEPKKPIEVITAPYPGYPTDLQPQLCPLMAAFFGGRITEGVWHGRFGYLNELAEFGVRYMREGSSVKVYPSRINSACAKSPDLRGGVACVMTALAANGESVISNSEVIMRGYSNLEEKLALLGADIKCIK